MTLQELLKSLGGLFDAWVVKEKEVPKKALALRRVIKTLAGERQIEDDKEIDKKYRYPKAKLDKSYFSKSFLVKDVIPEVEEYLAKLYQLDNVELQTWRMIANSNAKDFEKVVGNKIPEAIRHDAIRDISAEKEMEIIKYSNIKPAVKKDSEFDEKTQNLILDAGIKIIKKAR